MTNAVENYSLALNNALDARAAYETAKNADNNSIQAKLAKFRKDVTHSRITEIMLDANVDAELINKSERVNARYNEKAFVKVINIARVVAKVETLNVYTKAILATIDAFETATLEITQQETKLACSNNTKHANASRNKLLKRVAKHYDASTMSTQSSSSNQALLSYNVITEYRNEANDVCFKINRDNATAQALLALINA